jgi:lipopolysaccharide transport system permease protein
MKAGYPTMAPRDGVADILSGISSWRIWWMLASSDIARRYKRSKIGQVWLTLSMAAMILGVALVYAAIFGQSLQGYLPFIATGIVLWGLIAGCINEGATSLIESEAIIRQTDLAKFTYIMRTLTRNVLVFAHNLVLIPLVLLLTWTPVGWEILLFAPGLLLVMGNLAWIAYLLAMLSARFRDIPPIVQSVVQIAFFVTPVMFRPHQLPENHPAILLNPFSSLLAIVRDPLLGTVPTSMNYLTAIVLLCVGWLATFSFSRRYGRRVVYWL